MDKNMFIEIGKEKVIRGLMNKHLDDLDNMTFEILGSTEADYYGTTTIKDMKKKFDSENEIFDLKFYKYIDFQLKECSFIDALRTPEYNNDDIFIFSQAPEDKRLYYVTKIIKD